MAVTLADLKRKMRFEPGDDMGALDAELQDLLDNAVIAVGQYAPDAPEPLRDRCAILVATYLNDSPTAPEISDARERAGLLRGEGPARPVARS